MSKLTFYKRILIMVVSTRKRLKKGKYRKYEFLRIWMSDSKLLLFFLQNAYLYVSLSVLFLIASSLLFHMVFLSEAFAWVPKWTQQQLLVTGVSEWIFHLSLLLAYTHFQSTIKYFLGFKTKNYVFSVNFSESRLCMLYRIPNHMRVATM